MSTTTQTPTPPKDTTIPLSIERCPHCGGYLLEGRFPKGTYIETICRRCHGPEGTGRLKVVITR